MMTDTDYEQRLADYRQRYLATKGWERDWILEQVHKLQADYATDQEIAKRIERARELGRGGK